MTLGRGNDCTGRPGVSHVRLPRSTAEEPEPGSDYRDTLPVTVMAGIPVRKSSIAENQEVIDIPEVSPASKSALHEVVQAMEVHVRPKLAGHVSDWEPPSPCDRCQEIVSGEVLDARSCSLLRSMIRSHSHSTPSSRGRLRSRAFRLTMSNCTTYLNRRANSWHQSTARCVPLPTLCANHR